MGVCGLGWIWGVSGQGREVADDFGRGGVGGMVESWKGVEECECERVNCGEGRGCEILGGMRGLGDVNEIIMVSR